MFHANLSHTDGIINYKVKKHPITLSLEDFSYIFNMPFIEQNYDQMGLEGNKFTFETIAHSLLINPNSTIPSSFNVGLILPNIRLSHYTTIHVLFPKKGNYNTLSKSDILVVWLLENQVP